MPLHVVTDSARRMLLVLADDLLVFLIGSMLKRRASKRMFSHHFKLLVHQKNIEHPQALYVAYNYNITLTHNEPPWVMAVRKFHEGLRIAPRTFGLDLQVALLS